MYLYFVIISSSNIIFLHQISYQKLFNTIFITFYYHFKDIYDLVEWCCEEDASRALAGKKTYETWQQGLLQIFEAVQDNKPFILNVYRSVSREQVENYLYRITYDLLEGVVEEQAQGMSVRQDRPCGRREAVVSAPARPGV